MRVVLVVIASLVSFVAVGGLGTLAFGLSGSRVVTDSQALPAGIRMLTVDTGDVPVGVRLITDPDASEPHVDLRILTRATDTRMTVANDASGSRVTLGDNGSGFLWPVGAGAGEIKVILPPGVARGLSVTVSHRTGPLITESDLDQLIAKIDNGTVTLGGSARLIDVDVRHGDIGTSTGIAVTESFRAATETGRISVEFRAPPRTTEAIAGGNATVGLPGTEPYRVRAEAPRGETLVTVPETTDPSAAAVTARSTSGNVNVTEIR